MARNRLAAGAPADPEPSMALTGWLLWCLAIWVMWFARTPFALVERIQLMAFPDLSLLAGSRAWNPPLVYVADYWQINEVPYWLGSLLIAILLATAARWLAASIPVPMVAAGMLGLALVAQRMVVGDLSCIVLVAYLVNGRSRFPEKPEARVGRLMSGSAGMEWKLFLNAAIVFLLSIFVSLEFGLIAILLSCLVIGPQIKRRHQSGAPWMAVAVPIVWSLLVCLPGLFFSGYFSALLRPLHWAWVDIPPSLLPSMVPLWESSNLSWGYALLALPILERWRQAVTGTLPFFACLNLGLLTSIGIACGHYFWLAAAALFLTGGSESPTTVPTPSVMPRRFVRCGWLMVGLALLGVGIQLATQGSTILASDMIRRVIDPTQWNARGRVLLGNLEHSSTWQQPQWRRHYQLVLTDRWDVHHAAYQDYSATLDDWSNWRREAYLRSDGRWGGYQSRFSQWEPKLVVVDADNLPAIHRVSMDSRWKVIGIDPRNVVFASSDVPQNKAMIQYAARMLSILELPRSGAENDFQRVLAIGSRADSSRVSGVLTSLRLPYAGLRVLPRHGPAFTGTAAASRFAWCELAHRSHRYSGQHSLLDCCRGLSPAELGGGDSLVAATKRYREALTAAVRRDASQSFPGDLPSAASEAERTVRQHLKLGEAEQAIQHAAGLTDEGVREFYAAIAESAWRSSAEMIERLQSLSGRLSGERRAECLFYLGCLAIESDDFLRAREAFSEVSESSPPSPFKSLAEFYVSQL